MFNEKKPSVDELPSTTQLLRSAVIAALAAAVILVAAILPAEYGIDPTGAGRVLGLTRMGEIKKDLATEAEQDQLEHNNEGSSLWPWLGELLTTQAHAQDAWQDVVQFTIEPDNSTEIKLVMKEGTTAEYEWVAEGGRINFDLHAHGEATSVEYERGRGETSGAGVIAAEFAGQHGWYWRNRDNSSITVTLQLRGGYTEIIGAP